ncbi:MAG: hypothetical protein IPJ69_09685 [Deltaproteobacteria bacterium]|nr:MAG: hypothetical protein IPJ69_09685 [Deltaproteobacteria bacterium]
MLSALPVFLKKLFILSIFSISLLGFEPRALSYNFLYINPTTGAPIGWEPETTIHYYVDPGSLGRLTNEQARTLIRAAMDIWENASPYANTPRFVYEGLLPEDVDGTNYSSYVSDSKCYTSDLSLCASQAQRDQKTVIIFDEDNSILNNELCSLGAGCSAYGEASVFSGTSTAPINITASMLVLGRSQGLSDTKISSVMGTIVHELGHTLGLAHTSINEQAYIENLNGYQRYIPTMFFSFAPHNELSTEHALATLNPDDIAGITTLYPTASASTMLGTIKGTILKSDGTPMRHVNIIARNSNDPLCEAYSFLSGLSCAFAACNDHYIFTSTGAGGFTISALPSETYTIEVEEVANDNLGRTLAPGLLSDEDLYGDAEFWNTDDEADELNTLSSTLSLAAGETKENINIILNRSAIISDRIKYSPLSTFTASPSTRCSISPPVDYAALIGISESNTSGTGHSDGTGGTTSTTAGSGGTNISHINTATSCSLIF